VGGGSSGDAFCHAVTSATPGRLGGRSGQPKHIIVLVHSLQIVNIQPVMAFYNKSLAFLPLSLGLPNHTMPMSKGRKTLQTRGIGEPSNLSIFTPAKRHKFSDLLSSRTDCLFDLHLRLCVILVLRRLRKRRIHRRGQSSQALRSYPSPGGNPAGALSISLDCTWMQQGPFRPNDVMLHVC